MPPDRLGAPAEKVIRHDAQQEQRRADRQGGNHVQPRRAGQRQPGQNPEREQDQHRRRHQPPIHPRGKLLRLAVLVEEVDHHEGHRHHHQQAEHRVGNKGPAEEEVAEPAQQIGDDQRQGKKPQREQVGRAVGVERHAAGQQRGDEVHIGQQRQRDDQAGVLGEQKLRAADRFGQDRQGGPRANLARQRGRSAQHRPQQARQQHHRQRAVLDQLGLVPEREVVGRGQEDLEHGRAGHQQQEDRLPDQFHERVRRNGDELSHLLSQTCSGYESRGLMQFVIPMLGAILPHLPPAENCASERTPATVPSPKSKVERLKPNLKSSTVITFFGTSRRARARPTEAEAHPFMPRALTR